MDKGASDSKKKLPSEKKPKKVGVDYYVVDSSRVVGSSVKFNSAKEKDVFLNEILKARSSKDASSSGSGAAKSPKRR